MKIAFFSMSLGAAGKVIIYLTAALNANLKHQDFGAPKSLGRHLPVHP